MENQTILQPAHARCYKCGSPEIHGICHHCGRGMCTIHATSALPVRLGLIPALAVKFGFKKLSDAEFDKYEPGYARLSLEEEILSALHIGIISNPEYEGYYFDSPLGPDAGWMDRLKLTWRRMLRRLNLVWGNQGGGMIAKPLHCEFCAHNVSRYPAVMWVGLILTLSFIGALLGIPLLVLGYWLNTSRYIQAQIRQLSPIPIEGDLNRVQVRETVAGRITLDSNGQYITRREDASGVFSASMRFGGLAYERYCAYCQKANDLGVEKLPDKPIDVGYMLVGPANWEFMAGEIWLPERVNVIGLRTTLRESPLSPLLTNLNQSEAKLPLEYRYRVIQGDHLHKEPETNLPLQVVVSILPESNQQTLHLELELTDVDIRRKIVIEELILSIPNALGRIEQLKPEGKIEESTGERGNFQRITWKKLTFAPEYNDNLHRSIYIQFQNPIDPDTHLEGNLEVRMAFALSGEDEVHLFTPWGAYRKEQPAFDAETAIKIELDLDLSGLRYQTLQLLEKKTLREGVVPDSKLVSELVSVISEQDFYVKRVSENPARTSKEGAHKINRYWDIAGRKYEGVYPVDFHLVLTGEEQVHREGGYTVGQLTVEASVQGAVTDSEMAGRVQNVSDQLDELIRFTLDKIPLMPVTNKRIGPKPEVKVSVAPEEPAVLPDEIPTGLRGKETPRVEAPGLDAESDYLARVQTLKARIDRLEERVLDGAVSEDLYRELKAKYEKELQELNGGVPDRPVKKSSTRRETKK